MSASQSRSVSTAFQSSNLPPFSSYDFLVNDEDASLTELGYIFNAMLTNDPEQVARQNLNLESLRHLCGDALEVISRYMMADIDEASQISLKGQSALALVLQVLRIAEAAQARINSAEWFLAHGNAGKVNRSAAQSGASGCSRGGRHE